MSLELVLEILSARSYLAGIEDWEEKISGENACIMSGISIIEQLTCNIEYHVQKLLEFQTMQAKTAVLIQYLKDAGVDYTLLLYLQLQKANQKRGFISYLQGVCDQLDVPYRCRFLYDAVWAHFRKTGVKHITPSKFLMNRKKDEILEEYRLIRSRNDWAQHNPFFFQTFITTRQSKSFQKLVFFITRTWQDGVIRMLEILKQGSFVYGTTMYEAHGAFEHVIDDETMAGLILDSEIVCSAFQGHKTVEEIKEEVMLFPSIIASEMVEKGLLNEEDMLRATVKDKTRPRGDDVKVSTHSILSICAPKGHHKRALEVCIGDHKEEIARCLTLMKSQGHLPEDRVLATAWYAFDSKAAISNGFTTAFSLKVKSDPHSRKHSDVLICAGMQVSETLCPIQVQDFSDALTDEQRLWLLQEQLYTTPKRFMLEYAKEFEGVASKVLSRLASFWFIYLFLKNSILMKFNSTAIGICTHSPLFGGSKKRGRQFPAHHGLTTTRLAMDAGRRRSSTCQHG